ncbi:SDR family oxidoreductase [Kriegella aquimaris]|uniref:NAD(P)-dependent dehydrogenase, short-chain alcohol dehydrogenase family n=1 Tax=Kriegella aquimaris TaxID=192904 RepID=A0A1G9IFQ8_9FLAO|nr:SDR family oxidoreductase [Kriegella aquimaris]SDL23952.1 NAD(P)-dependent dehydrogenase, short-chain alcohol dehydrogenase family [Kriegella aquimaris]
MDYKKDDFNAAPLNDTKQRSWALILGGSSGLGMATAKKLARKGFHIIIIHRDRKLDIQRINANFEEITLMGVKFANFNVDGTKIEKIKASIEQIKELVLPEERISVFVHSIAKGSLKPMFSDSGQMELNRQDFEITLEAMAISLYDWTQALVHAGLFADDTRIIAFTSEGNTRAWKNYAAVSAAKVALEAITRNIALEYAPQGIKANCIQAGVTDTVSLNRIPGSAFLKENALERNPNGRLTTPEDVANVVYLLTTKEAQWITGTVVKVDGGESLR